MAPKKKVTGLIKLQIEAGAANPAPPVGPALGAHGVNIMEFCKAYNAATESQRGNVVPVEITVYEDRSFDFKLKTPPAAKLLLKAAGIKKGSGVPHTDKVGKVTWISARRSQRPSSRTCPLVTSRTAPASSPAPLVPWASRSRAHRRSKPATASRTPERTHKHVVGPAAARQHHSNSSQKRI